MHGHLYIILKESIKYIPIIGQGMMFYGFIFLSRKWEKDKERLQYRLRKLSGTHKGPLSGKESLDPMWLLIFPEGTNLSDNGRAGSKRWAEKNDIPDLRHAMLPRSTGLLYCISELQKNTDWVYDCTVAYEGVPPGEYGQDIFTLRSTYFEGRPPKSVHMHWRRFATKDIPTGDKEFGDWLLKRWREKDDMLEYFQQHNCLPADDGISDQFEGTRPLKGAGRIETYVRPNNPLEFLFVLAPIAAAGLVVNVIVKFWIMILRILRIK
ncbi:hypothetical protein M011DRAFT_467325 [Sporormia fimetaria CBS 119925]|uniref:Phospholipid/glycerol acyltransferase domain-containing protein n=1 Tax=Sporormia fimetaria CBS 119925 TaxID=1340428 RepID=A0A6A6VCV1_9PLEO|nr:hypothetical protein M011DRAFT_467325 [Sporormia fimetaria CBS 119925]